MTLTISKRAAWSATLLSLITACATIVGGDCETICNDLATARAAPSTSSLMSTERNDSLVEKTTCSCPELYESEIEQDAGTDSGPPSDSGLPPRD